MTLAFSRLPYRLQPPRTAKLLRAVTAMATRTCCPAPEVITSEEFQDALSRYDTLIESVSASVSASKGQAGLKTLVELDRYRFQLAPALFASETPAAQAMQLQHVKQLVEWKLKHGKFRPTLMKLVSSNDESASQETITRALGLYKATTDRLGAIEVLTELRGIGPATASLLLAVHDPQQVIFFADEAFYWLCCGGKKVPIKYSLKEYRALNEKWLALAARLGVTAADVERVAYVLLNDVAGPTATAPHREAPALPGSVPQADDAQPAPAKRKQDPVGDDAAPAPGRSRRARRA